MPPALEAVGEDTRLMLVPHAQPLGTYLLLGYHHQVFEVFSPSCLAVTVVGLGTVVQTALPHRMGAKQAWDKPEEQTSESSMSRWEDFQIVSDSSDSSCAFGCFSVHYSSSEQREKIQQSENL